MDNLVRIAHLSEEDLLSLPEKVTESLAVAFDSIVHEANEAKKRNKQYNEEQEAKLIAVSEECSRLRSEFDQANKNLANLREVLSKEEKKSQDLSADRDKISQKLNSSQSIVNELELVISRLENDKESLNELLNKRNEECERLSDEIHEIREEVSSIRQMKSDIITQLEEIKTEKAILNLREKHLGETSASIKEQNTWLEEELHKANDKLLSIRRDYSERFHDLESELNAKKTEVENSKITVSKLEAMVKKLTESNEDHIDKLKLRTDELTQLEQMHARELDAQRRLTDLYKEKSVTFEMKCEELQKAVVELRELLQQGHSHVVLLQSEKKSIIEAFNAEKESLIATNTNITNELNSLKEIVEKFRINGLSQDELLKINPAIASTLASIKSGRSLIDIFAEYLQVVEERDRLRVDKGLLDAHIRELIEQLEEKAPVLRSQQEAFKKSKERVAELEKQLEAAQHCVKEREENLNYQLRRAGYFQRQTQRLKDTCKDLSVQVKTLLYELESARGTVIDSATMEENNALIYPNNSTDDIDSQRLLSMCSTAASVIDTNLVTFKSLSDLQTQNTRLLLVARDLAAQLEAHETNKESLNNHILEITAKVDILSGEVEVARLAASEARSESKLAVRQRDVYKSLLQRHSIPLPDLPQPDESSGTMHEISGAVRGEKTQDQPMSSQNLQSQTVAKLEQSLCSLHAEFKQYREDKTRSDEVFSETIINLRKESTEARILNQKLAAQLDFTHEKFRTLEANVENYKREISVLREMNARYTTSAAASDEALSSTRQQSARLSDRLAESEVQCRQLIRQVEQLRANGDRLSRELEHERKTALVHQKLMNQLQSIQAHLEHRNETETRQAARRIESLEEQLKQVKKDATEKQDKLFSLNTTLQSELTHARQLLRTAEEEISQLRETAAKLPEKPSSDSGSSAPVSSHTHSSALSTSVPEGDQLLSFNEGDQPLLVKLRALERECASLQTSLEAARKQCSEYQQLGNEMELHIRQLTQEREQAERARAAELDDAINRCESLTLQLELEKNEREDLGKEKSRLEKEFSTSLKTLRDELATAQISLKSAEEKRESAIAVEISSRAEVAAHLRTAKEAREKYEMELRLHSQDVELLMEARKAAEDARAEVENLRIALETAKSSLKRSEAQLAEQSNVWEESRSRLVKRIEDADAEVSRLQEQILKLTEQIVNLRKLMEHNSEQPICLEESASKIQDSEDFIHLLDYLRRQKSIAEAAEESANAELNRMHLRTKTLESQVADLQAKLSEERQKSEIRYETSTQHAALIKQIEQINLLNESNRLLRQEREMIREVAARSEERLASLQSEMEPLRAKCTELEDAKEILVSEKHSLAEERDRWKERCARLVETSKRMDPEELRQACMARDQLQTQLQILEESKAFFQRQSVAKIADLDQQIASLSTSLARNQTENQDLVTKLTGLEEKCSQYEHELTQRQVKITKLREIGRKYRQEADELRRRLLTTQKNEENRKTSEEGVVAIRADLLAAQSDLQSEQEQSSLLKREFKQLQELIEQVEALPDMEFLKEAPAEPLISTNPSSSDVFNRLNALLSALIARITQMHNQTEEQAERLLRMQLIESQLTKTKRQCAELRSKLAAVSATSSSYETQAGETTDVLQQQVKTSPKTAKVSWSIKAAAAVQPVQTPSPNTSPGSLSSIRQTAEIRPLPNFVATVLPNTTAINSTLESQVQAHSYLTPLTTQPTEQPIVDEPQPVSPGGHFSTTSMDQCSSSFIETGIPSLTLVKRSYEEALLSDEAQIFGACTAAQLSQDATQPSLELQTPKRLRPATPPAIQFSNSSVSQIFSEISASAQIEPDPAAFGPLEEFSRDDEAEDKMTQESVAEISRGERDIDQLKVDNTIEDNCGIEEQEEEERSSDACVIINPSRDDVDMDHLRQEEEDRVEPGLEEEEKDEETQSDYEIDEGEEDHEAAVGDAYGDEDEAPEEHVVDVEGDDAEEEDEDEVGGAGNPVIVVSSSDEEQEDNDEAEESDAEETRHEEKEDIGEAEQQPTESSQSDQGDEDEQANLKSQLHPLKPSTSLLPPAPSSTFDHFGSGDPPLSGGLFSNIKPIFTCTDKPTSLFSGFSTSSSVTSVNCESLSSLKPLESGLIRPSTNPSFTPIASKPNISTEENMAGAGTSKQKIRPIIWTESSDGSRKHSTPASSTPGTSGMPRGANTEMGVPSGTRWKNWGPFGGSPISRGAPRGGHR